jgi:hypothetical protein
MSNIFNITLFSSFFYYIHEFYKYDYKFYKFMSKMSNIITLKIIKFFIDKLLKIYYYKVYYMIKENLE